MAAEPIQVVYDGGVYLPEADLWLDPQREKPRAFISHAHADHFAAHDWSVCSTTTKQFVEKRFGRGGDVAGQAFGEEFGIGDFRCVLLPAGHILGSAQLWLQRLRDGESLLYTGDFKTRPGAACEPVEWRSAETLIMETTFGVPKYRMPPTGTVIDDMVRFLHETLDDGDVPMLAAYSLGKAQEIMVAIHQAAPELEFLLHSSVSRMTEIYRDFGFSLPEWEVIGAGTDFAGRVVIAPPASIRSQQLRKVKNRITAMVTGWGVDSGAKFRYQVDHVFPLSDHADYDDLLDFVDKVDPRRILTLHGFAGQFASDLRERGREAWSLISGNQMELRLGGRSPALEDNSVVAQANPAGEFGAFAEVCERIYQASGRLKKVALLAGYFAGLNRGALGLAALFLTARPFGRTERTRSLQTGWAILRRSVLAASGLTEAEYRQKTLGQNEPGRAALLVLQGQTRPGEFSLANIRGYFDALTVARGPAEKSEILAALLGRMHAREARFLVGILTGDLRIGLKEGLVEEALAEAFDGKVAEVRRAHMLTGDLGLTAGLAAAGDLDSARLTPFVPLQAMLASPCQTAEAIWNRLSDDGLTTGVGVWLEDKFDGIRAQLHRVGGRVEIFSRDLRVLTTEFSELAGPALALREDVILDGEIIAFAEGRKLSFFDLQKRLGKRSSAEGDLFLGASVPVRFVAFDLLWKGGDSLIDLALHQRHDMLLSLQLSEPFEAVTVHRANAPEEIDAAFKAARRRGNEGLIAKRGDSAYSPGRRGHSWLKLKKAMATLDCVVVKAEEGHGKRSHVLSDYTFSIRDTATGGLVVLGKAYSGLTDIEIEELTEHFNEHTLATQRRVHVVEPNIVLEIAFDSIQPSKRHSSGLSLRFPRIKAIRRDKTVEDIDTLQFARSLAGVE